MILTYYTTMNARNERVNIEAWNIESTRYCDKINKIKKIRYDIDEDVIKKLPRIPLEYPPSFKGLYAVKISIYVLSFVNSSLNSTTAFLIIWEKGLLSAISLHARQIFECWGAIHYAYQLLLEMNVSEDYKKLERRCARLLCGARSEVQMPWGGTTKEKSIHIMDLIRSLKDVYPEAEKNYDFLCESCHTNFFR